MSKSILKPLPSLLPGAEARKEFPIFSRHWQRRLSYLDTAASSQKPSCVIDRLTCFYSEEHSNIHRGAYSLSAEATLRYEEARNAIAKLLSARDARSIVFTRGTTEGINLVAHSYEKFLKQGDSILLTLLEHHSNIVPWQLLAARKGLQIVFAEVTDAGELRLDDLEKKITQYRPKLIACTQLSNALGTLVPVEHIIACGHAVGAKVLVDAAQSIAHSSIDVGAMDADFLVFSGHKLYGPTGIGVLYAKPELLEAMDPFLGGGDMIREVTTSGSTWADIPSKFEAGTPPIAEAVALGTAVEFIRSIGLDSIKAYEAALFQKAFDLLSREPGVTLYGPITKQGAQASILSFNVKNTHAHDLSTVADTFNVQLRAGHHCAMPLLQRLGIGSSARISLGVYSTEDDFPPLLEAIRHARDLFS
ncbi:MAG: SufS family cysteine desulfurase [Deltaproteobacteria bacterium]|nr:SufS family cysteine desulfurase [Deltaproteobacteria bacterium]